MTTDSADSTFQVSCTYASGFYHLSQGRIGGEVLGHSCQCLEGRAEVAARDVFEITGIPGNGSIPCTIRLHFTGSLARPLHQGGPFVLSGVEFAQLERRASAPGGWDGWWPDLDESVVLDVVIDGNTPFSLTYWLMITSYYTSELSRIEGRLTFLGLPAGARVTSCRGFSQVGVGVEQWTWARVKSLYK